MTRIAIVGGALAVLLALLVASFFFLAVDERPAAPVAIAPVADPTETWPAPPDGRGFQHGRVTTVDGTTYEGRLRWGGGEEAYWTDFFNGAKAGNPWIEHVPDEERSTRRTVSLLGIRLGERTEPIEVDRPFMARFGDIARIDARATTIGVTMKSGRVVELDRFGADDLADGVRIDDPRHGTVDIGEARIRSVELLPTPPDGGDAPYRPQGTVRTRLGELRGFVTWDRDKGVGTDVLEGFTADGPLAVRLDTIRSIARDPRGGVLVTLLDGRTLALSGTADTDDRNRGVLVDDERFGRVGVDWSVFERVDFGPGGSGPGYEDHPAGRPLDGRVITRDGRTLAGRLVFDLDESETTDTLDAPDNDVDYSIPFALIASIDVGHGTAHDDDRVGVTLHDGTTLRLERNGDLAEANGGLIVLDESTGAEYVPWADVERIIFDRPDTPGAPDDQRGISPEYRPFDHGDPR